MARRHNARAFEARTVQRLYEIGHRVYYTSDFREYLCPRTIPISRTRARTRMRCRIAGSSNNSPTRKRGSETSWARRTCLITSSPISAKRCPGSWREFIRIYLPNLKLHSWGFGLSPSLRTPSLVTVKRDEKREYRAVWYLVIGIKCGNSRQPRVKRDPNFSKNFQKVQVYM